MSGPNYSMPIDPFLGEVLPDPVEHLSGPLVDDLHRAVAAISSQDWIYLSPGDKYDGDRATLVDSVYGEPLIIRRTRHHAPETVSEKTTMLRGLVRWVSSFGKTRDAAGAPDVAEGLQYDYSFAIPDHPSTPGQQTIAMLHAPQGGNSTQFSASQRHERRWSPILDKELEQTLTVVDGLITNGFVRTKENHAMTEALKPQPTLTSSEAMPAYSALEAVMRAEGFDTRSLQILSVPLKFEVLGADHKLPYAIERVVLSSLPRDTAGHSFSVEAKICFANSRFFVSLTADYDRAQLVHTYGRLLNEQLRPEDYRSDTDIYPKEVQMSPARRLAVVNAITTQLVPGNLIRTTEA